MLFPSVRHVVEPTGWYSAGQAFELRRLRPELRAGQTRPADNPTMREHGFLLSSKPAKRGSEGSRCFQRSSTCHAPKGAAARCCSLKALGWAWKERLWYVAP